jgi:hypothetical protein
MNFPNHRQPLSYENGREYIILTEAFLAAVQASIVSAGRDGI